MTMVSSDLACPICGGAGLRQADHPEVTLYRCSTCTHCYTDPSSIERPEAYDSDYFVGAHRNWFSNPNTALFEIIRSEAGVVGGGLSLLDVGCGKGDLLVHLRGREPSWRLTGIDLSPNAETDGIKFLQGDIFDMPAGETYDVVTNLLVIEHVADVHRFVDELRKLCRPGGRLIITTNDEQSVLYAVARLLRRVGRNTAYDRLYSCHHLNHFSVRTLRQLLEMHALPVVRTVHHNIPIAAVDVPPAGPLTRAIWQAGIRGAFALGSATGRTFLQTVICELPGKKGKNG